MRNAFRAMGTEIALLADDEQDGRVFASAVAEVAAIFEREEQRFSRFRDDSELASVNRAGGGWIDVSQPFAEVVALALDGAAATAGLFDPTVLHALEAAGYDRTFAEVRSGARGSLRAVPCGRWREIEVRRGRIRLPEGVGLDLGGIAKGWTADRAAEAAAGAGLTWAIVNAGGDLRVAGDAPALEVGVEDPDDRAQHLCTVRIDGGALATSSVTLRRWGPERHHVIDPRIGLPARSPVVQATVWAPTCAAAEVAGTRALLEGMPALEELAGVLVLASGEVVTNLTTGAAA
ncbi:MAG TPA: FAD:protein FMN transferase [Actinomycetota bacterium]|nr:FAD:protein FMN transferase [Actinomycetota bacterium]